MRYEVTYKDGSKEILETPESALRLVQHAHIDKAVRTKKKAKEVKSEKK